MKHYFRIMAAALALIAVLFTIGCTDEATDVPSGFDAEYDMCVIIDGVNYAIRTDSAPLLSALGEAYEYSEQISCIYDGMDKTFTYDGLVISTVPVDGADVIEMFTITSDAYETRRGIKIGDTLEDIVAAYGEEYFDDGYVTYTESNDMTDISEPRIQFYMESGAVAEIYIYSPSY